MASAVIAAASGTVSYYARQVPASIWRYAKGKFLIEIKVDSTTELYNDLNQVLLPLVEKANYRFFAVEKSETSNSEESDIHFFPIQKQNYRSDVFGNSNKLNYRIVPGSGTFWFFHKGVFYFANKESKQNAPSDNASFASFMKPAFTITLTAVTRNRDKALSLLHEIIDFQSQPNEKLRVYRNDSWNWDEAMVLPKRSFDTVILNDGVEQSIKQSIDGFLTSKDTYQRIGTPYRFGICLEGPTGTGKTSLVQAIATYYRRNIYILSLSAVTSDARLQNLINCTSPGSIILFEGVDSQGVDLRERTEDSMIKRGDSKEQITFSGILNAIDGLTTPEDRIFIYTTNMFSMFDSAFIRPGRIDQTFKIDNLFQPAQHRMGQLFFPGNTEFVGVEKQISPAVLKQMLCECTSASQAQQRIMEL